MKQTAVEWLVEFLALHGVNLDNAALNNVINQAKEMEREQLAKAESRGADAAVESLWKMMNDRG
jgi:hypothetical protein